MRAETGLPIEGALVAYYEDTARTLIPGEDPVLTDAQGVAELVWPAAVPSERVGASKKGWQSTGAPVKDGEHQLELVLRSGVTQKFLVLDAWGTPIDGAYATLSRACLPRDETKERSDLLPAPAPQAAFRGESNASGVINIEGLVPGDYLFRIQADGYVPAVLPDSPLRIPGPLIQVVLEPLVAVVAEAGDGIVRTFVVKQTEPAVIDFPSSPGQGEWMHQSDRWKRRFPGAMSLVGVMKPEFRNALRYSTMSVEVAALVEGHGWGIGTAQIRLLPCVSSPEKIQFTWTGRATSMASLALLTPDGSRINEGIVTVETDSPLENLKAKLEIPLGTEIELPNGEFELLRHVLPVQFGPGGGKFVVQADRQHIDVEIAEYCRQVTIQVRLPDGDAPTCSLLECRGRGVSRTSGLYGEQLRLWIANGPFSIRVRAPGVAPWREEYPEGIPGSTVRCNLAWQD